ncbi:transposase [Streptomyces sp. NPDC090022]|uniref:transposase n=1 Tax=Streptomyces sp. NPDC090022 TaxID=3365920 RepID=UPI0038261CBB
MRWRTRTGTPWRDAPERYGPWGRAYDLFRRWQRDSALAADLHRTAGPGRRQGPDHLGPRRRLHWLPGTPARRRGARERGTCNSGPCRSWSRPGSAGTPTVRARPGEGPRAPHRAGQAPHTARSRARRQREDRQRWPSTLTTRPLGSRTRNRRTPHSSSCRG